MQMTNKPKVLLINMPWAQIQAPSIQLGILKSSLVQHGIPTDVVYLNIDFAKILGVKLYDTMIADSGLNFFCEWLFRDYIMDSKTDETDDSYLNYLQNRLIRKDKQTGVSETINPLVQILGSNYRQWIDEIKNRLIPVFFAEIFRKIKFNDYDIIGFTCMFAQTIPALALARQIKTMFPGKLIVMGGSAFHEEMGLEYLKKFSGIDCVAHGEGEEALVEIVNLFRSGATYETMSQTKIPGVSWRFGDRFVCNIKRNPLQDLDKCPLPDYDDYFSEAADLETESGKMLRFESARGCWWGQKHQCNFCGLNGSQVHYRSKSPERVMAEMVYLSAKYKCLTFLAVDNVINMKYFDELLPKIHELDYNFTIFYEIKANLNKEHVRTLADAGILNVQPGIESFHTTVLKLMSKGVKAIQNIQLIKWCKEFKIDPVYNLLWGFPGEKPEHYQEMALLMPKLVHLTPPSYPPRRLTLERFSPYFTNPDAYGIKDIQPAGDYHYLYPKEVDLAKIAYIFSYTSSQLPNDLSYIHRVTASLKNWHDRYYSSEPAVLFYEKGPGFTKIYDTRYDGLQTIVLEDLASEIYQYCDEIRSLDRIKEFGATRFGDYDQEILPVLLNQLVEKNLMIQEGDWYLSLALPKQSVDQELQKLLKPAG